MDVSSLKNQLWTTRVSRINAERRLIRKNSFIQGINIYYSCVTIILSILSMLLEDDANLGAITTVISICLLISILYLNGQRYLENAQEYKINYTEIHRLEMTLDKIDITPEEVMSIRMKYCDLLNSGCNHSTYDYYCTVYGANENYRKENGRWKSVRVKFYFGKIWRMGVYVSLIILPIVILGIWFVWGGYDACVQSLG